MALVNTKWYYASIHPKFVRNEVFSYNEKREKFDKTFGDSGLPLFSEFKTMLLNSNRKCFNLIFHGSLYVNQVFPIFLNLADYIVSVHISGLDQLSDMLLDVILNCNKLEQLEFNCVSDLVITNRPRKSILSLKRMSFRETNLTDFYFNNIMQCAPNLEDLGLKNCNILNWHQALRRFYPTYKNTDIKQNFNSCDIFSYVSIVNYLETTKNIHKLRLNDNFHIILNLPIHIKLVSLELSFVKALTILRGQPYEKIGDKLSNISTLENLDLKYIPCCLLVSCLPKLCNLKRLNAQYFHCRNQNECISEVVDSLKNKKNLRELIMYSFLVQDNLIPLGIADCTLEKLSTYKGSINNVFKISRLGQNLTKLKIVNGDILTASDYKLLFKTLIRLKKLVIEKCNELDDNVLSDFSINNLKGNGGL